LAACFGAVGRHVDAACDSCLPEAALVLQSGRQPPVLLLLLHVTLNLHTTLTAATTF
jgi:hypothetical protein